MLIYLLFNTIYKKHLKKLTILEMKKDSLKKSSSKNLNKICIKTMIWVRIATSSIFKSKNFYCLMNLNLKWEKELKILKFSKSFIFLNQKISLKRRLIEIISETKKFQKSVKNWFLIKIKILFLIRSRCLSNDKLLSDTSRFTEKKCKFKIFMGIYN